MGIDEVTDVGVEPMPKLRKIISAIDKAMAWPIDLVVLHFERRLFELATSVMMFGVASFIVMFPGSLETSALRYMLDFTNHAMIVGVFAFFGIARIVALGLNGNWMPWGGYVRAGGAAVGAIMWAQWVASFYSQHLATQKPLSLGCVPFACLAFFETIAFYRALHGASVSHGKTIRAGLGSSEADAADPGALSGSHSSRSGLADTAHSKGP
jgi:hypothetical protein